MTFTHMWTDDCGDIAIHWMAFRTMGYCYSDRGKDAIPNMYLIKGDRYSEYEWFIIDNEYTLEDFNDF